MNILKYFKILFYFTFIFSMEIKESSKYQYNNNGRIILPENSIIENLPKDGGTMWNRLIFENSPYLLQHAANPVDWYPWGDEAFKLSKELNKPIFLSIGYTTCHWCHVMEHESFEDLEVATLMNETFINIKVDREERPDIDNVYMEVTQNITGRGGWPMTIIMTPDKKPFFAGTYFPKKSKPRYNRPGMIDIVPQIKELWNLKQDSLLNSASQIVYQIQNNHVNKNSKQLLKETILKDSYNYFNTKFDLVYGGFTGSKNKFPKPHDYSFLLRYYYKTKDPKALEIVEKSLYEMRKGGIYDQIGFGFHRYSTDNKWLVPHFEKMLYDQALLIHTYLDAYQLTGNEFYANTVDEICEYVIRDMRDVKGGFYSAEDADSQGEEGLFYTWDTIELRNILSDKEYNFIKSFLSLNDNGNAIVEGQRTNIPHITKTIEEMKDSSSSYFDDFNMFNNIRKKIFNNRELRVHPQKDDKILTDWNGLMISAFARASVILESNEYLETAKFSADFIINNLIDKDGGLLKHYRNGNSDIKGMIEDYAFFIWGLIELYQADFDVKYIKLASQLSDYQVEHFWDYEDKGFFFTSDIGEKLFIRSKEIYDGAIPSGNSVSALNFLRLGRILSRFDYDEISYDIIEAFSNKLNRFGAGSSFLLQAVNYIEGPSYEIIIKGNRQENIELFKEIMNHEQPNKVLIYDDGKNNYFNFLDNYPEPANEGVLVYVCQNYSCNLPTNNLDKIKKMLE